MLFKAHLIALQTILGKEIFRFMRIWPQTILPAAVTTSLYFLIFGHLIGQRIGAMDGIPYMDFIVPGISLMSIITNSFSNVVSSFYSSKFQKNIEELIAAPVPNWVILLGYVGGGVFRGFVVGLVVTAIGLAFSESRMVAPGLVLLVFGMTSIFFATLGLINAIFADSFDDISIVPNFVLTPLVYLGGVFYSVDLLPEFWKTISLANPILYLVNAYRCGFIGVCEMPVWSTLWPIGLVSVLLLLFALWLLQKGIRIKS